LPSPPDCKYVIGPRREGGLLRIVAQPRGNRLEVAVIDDGVGLHVGVGSGPTAQQRAA